MYAAPALWETPGAPATALLPDIATEKPFWFPVVAAELMREGIRGE
jgi:hypothetical protein